MEHGKVTPNTLDQGGLRASRLTRVDRLDSIWRALMASALVLVSLALPAIVAGVSASTPAAATTSTSMVASPTVTATSHQATATGVGYTVAFVATNDAALGNGTVTLTAPAGTVFPSQAACGQYVVRDVTLGSSQQCALQSGAGTDSVTLTTPNLGVGDQAVVTVDGISNPTSVGSGTLSIVTNNDQTPATVADNTVAATSISNLFLNRSSAAAGATQVTYTMTFTSPSGMTPEQSSDPMSTVSVTAPSGVVFPSDLSCTSYELNDLTTGTSNASGCGILVGGSGTNKIVLAPPTVSPGDQIQLLVNGATNPTAAGGGTLSVITSSNPVAKTVADPTNAAAGVNNLIVTPGPADGDDVVSFVSPAGMTAPIQNANLSAVTLTAPSAVSFPTDSGCHTYVVEDLTTGAENGCGVLLSGADTNKISLATPTVGPGDLVAVTIDGVTGPAISSISASTTSSPEVVSSSPVSTSGTKVGGVVLTRATPAAGATGTDIVRFVATHALTPPYDISVTASSGTVFPTNESDYFIDDVTTATDTGGGLNYHVVSGTGSNQVQISSAIPYEAANPTINAGDQVIVVIAGVQNPSAAGTGSLSISTSSDATSVSAPANSTASSAVSSLSLATSSSAAGATDVTDSVLFTATHGFDNGSLITLAAPAGTVLPTSGDNQNSYLLEDLTTRSSSGDGLNFNTVSGGGTNHVTVDNNADGEGGIVVSQGDQVLLTLHNVTNPTSAGTGKLSVSTSSDSKQVAASLNTTSATAPSSTVITQQSGTDVTMHLRFVATHALLWYYQINLDAPAGTVFPAASNYTIDDVTSGASVGPNAYDFGGTGSNDVSISDGISYENPSPTIGAGDLVFVTVSGVTSPPTTKAISVSTSGDPKAASVLAQVGTPLSGRVTNDGTTVANSTVQACPTSGPGICSAGITASDGTFTLSVSQGATYQVTAYPPKGTIVGTGSAGPIKISSASGVSGVNVQLGPAPSLAAGVTITNGGTTYSSSTTLPRVYWGDPFQVSFAPSMFPAGNTLITQVNVTGLNQVTGQLETVGIPPGGTVDGLSVPVTPGTPITIPAVEPNIHGPVSITADYLTYPTSSSSDALKKGAKADTTTSDGCSSPGTSPPSGIGMPGQVDFPSGGTGDDSDQIMTIGNNGISPDTFVTLCAIVGPDASDFSVVDPKSGDTDLPDCDDAQLIELYSAAGTGTTTCGNEIQWAPSGNSLYEYAYAVVTISPAASNSDSSATVLVPLIGCDSALGACGTAGVIGYPLAYPGQNPKGGANGCSSGTFSYPPSSQHKFSIGFCSAGGGSGGSGSGGSGSGGVLGSPSTYIDPSGTVQTMSGNQAIPLANANVTLEQAPNSLGPFTPVPNGSSVMSPANQVNPGTTDQNGSFGWDTLAGTYDVDATATNCQPGSTGPVTVPPPATNLIITLTCSSPPSLASTATTLEPSPNPAEVGTPVVLTADVTGTSPSGTVTFFDGSTNLGTAPVNGSGVATMTTSGLAPGDHNLTATYNGDGVNATSTSSPVTQVIDAPPTISSFANVSYRVNTFGSYTINTAGFPTPTLTESGSLPHGLHFTDNGNGTATISGTPASGSGGGYPIVVQASNSSGSVTKDILIGVDQAPIFTSPLHASFTVGQQGSFEVTTTGSYPTAVTMSASSGSLPAGLSFTDNGNGTATISGKPVRVVTKTASIKAQNAVLASTKSLTITVARS